MNPAISRKRRAQAHSNSNNHGQQSCATNQMGGCAINIGEDERQISMLGGGVLAAYGLMRGSLTGLALAAIGGALLYRGYTGHCQLYEMLGHSTADEDREAHEQHHHEQPMASHAAL